MSVPTTAPAPGSTPITVQFDIIRTFCTPGVPEAYSIFSNPSLCNSAAAIAPFLPTRSSGMVCSVAGGRVATIVEAAGMYPESAAGGAANGRNIGAVVVAPGAAAVESWWHALPTAPIAMSIATSASAHTQEGVLRAGCGDVGVGKTGGSWGFARVIPGDAGKPQGVTEIAAFRIAAPRD